MDQGTQVQVFDKIDGVEMWRDATIVGPCMTANGVPSGYTVLRTADSTHANYVLANIRTEQ